MQKTNIRYWLCQVGGWGLWGLIFIYFYVFIFGDRFLEQGGKKEYLISLGIYLVCGILCTHLLRTIIKRTNWLKYSFNTVLALSIVGVGAISILMYYGGNAIEHNTPYSYDNFMNAKRLDKARRMEQEAKLDTSNYFQKVGTAAIDTLTMKTVNKIKNSTGWHRNKKGEWKYEIKSDLYLIYQNFLVIALWMLIYLVFHYVQRNRNDQLDRLKLVNTVKELELKTIKSHINPHFIFNSLNSIRALVDENPTRARRAITELSNILRSSMQAEKAETVTLEKELDIVKDYLALEHMRFEERLRVEFDIDPDTLQHPVPPMMLQTLVENAIKHGISKQINGGLVRVVSEIRGGKLELLVQNTGQLVGELNEDGFGIKSTQDRLNLMYQGKAAFNIQNSGADMVESKVTMPVIA